MTIHIVSNLQLWQGLYLNGFCFPNPKILRFLQWPRGRVSCLTWETPMVGSNMSNTPPSPPSLPLSEMPEDDDYRRPSLPLLAYISFLAPLLLNSSDLGDNWCPCGSPDRRTHTYTQSQSPWTSFPWPRGDAKCKGKRQNFKNLPHL